MDRREREKQDRRTTQRSTGVSMLVASCCSTRLLIFDADMVSISDQPQLLPLLPKHVWLS